MVANILVTDSKSTSIEKTISGACDIALCVSVPDMTIMYALSAEVLYVLSRRGHFSVFGRAAGVSFFLVYENEKQLLERLEKLFGSVMTEYASFFEPDDEDDDDRDIFRIGMI